MPEDDMPFMLRLIEEKICSSEIEVRHRDALVRLRCILESDLSEVEQAAVHYRQALSLAEELGMRPLAAHCHHGLGTLYAEAGQHEQARVELSEALELYRALDMMYWLPQVEARRAQVGNAGTATITKGGD